MFTQRQNKVGRLIQKELASVFQKEGKSFSANSMVTITVVRMSPDLSIARVYLSIFPSDRSEQVLELIEENMGTIRGLLGKNIRNQVKSIPVLKFFVDDSMDYAQRIDDLLNP